MYTNILRLLNFSQRVHNQWIQAIQAKEISPKRRLKLLKKLDIPKAVADANLLFEDKHKGQRCFIIGNGPSLREQDLTVLKNEQVFTVNYIYKNPQYLELNSNYHFFMDPACFNLEKHPAQEISNISQGDCNPTCFLPFREGYGYVIDSKLDKMLDIHYLFPYLSHGRNCPPATDISSAIKGYYSVVHYAILTAIYMGFKEIYLLGCDSTGIITDVQVLQDLPSVAGYSYDFSTQEKKNLQHEYETRIKIQDTFSGWAKIFDGYEELLSCCEKKGIKLLNATHGGILNSVPRVKFESLF